MQVLSCIVIPVLSYVVMPVLSCFVIPVLSCFVIPVLSYVVIPVLSSIVMPMLSCIAIYKCSLVCNISGIWFCCPSAVTCFTLWFECVFDGHNTFLSPICYWRIVNIVTEMCEWGVGGLSCH